MKFENYNLSNEVLKAISAMNFQEPTPIQQKAIPILLGDDIDFIGQARTGTGKTAAFGIPLIEKVDVQKAQPQALVLAPTRELCRQITFELKNLAQFKRVRVVAVYGGQAIEIQERALAKPAQIIAGTPGRVMDLVRRGVLNLDGVKYFVLDEADVMLDMGFLDDIKTILSYLKSDRNIWLFSATIPREIRELSRKYMNAAFEVNLNRDNSATKNTDQHFYVVKEGRKFEALTRILDSLDNPYGLIFCETKLTVKLLSGKLKRRGYKVDCLHGDLKQSARDRVMADFKNKRLNFLVATDVAARGIDIMELPYVINYDISKDSKTHVHRIGRTGRIDKRGVAITIVEPQELHLIKIYARKTGSIFNYQEVPSSEVMKNRYVGKILSEIEAVAPDEQILNFVKNKERYSDNESFLLAKFLTVMARRSHTLNSENLNYFEDGLKTSAFEPKKSSARDRFHRRGRRAPSARRKFNYRTK